MYHSLFILLPIKRHLGWFQVLANKSKAIININVQVLCGNKFSVHLGKCQGLHAWFPKKLPNCLLKYYFAFPPIDESCYCSISLPALVVVIVLDFSHLISVWQYLVLICNFLMTYNIEHLFICLLAFCIFSLVR